MCYGYACHCLWDADKSQSITITEVDGKKAYKVGNVELVDVLNGACKNISGALEWLNKPEAPNNPVHITRWDGSFEPGVKGVITLVYDPNGGDGAAVTEQQRVEGCLLYTSAPAGQVTGKIRPICGARNRNRSKHT